MHHPAYTGRKPNQPPPEKAKGGRGKKGGVADAARKAGVSRSTAQRHIAKKAKPAQTERRAGLSETEKPASAGTTKPEDIRFAIEHRISTVQALAVDAFELLKEFGKNPFAAAKINKTFLQETSSFAEAAITHWSIFKLFCDETLAAAEGKAVTKPASEVTGSIDIDVTGLSATAQGKLSAALKKAMRQLHAEYAARMRGIDEEVRLRVVERNKDYLEMLNTREKKLNELETYLQRAVRDHSAHLTADEFNLLRKCLHQKGIAAEPQDFDSAFHLIHSKKLQLTGAK